MYDVITLGSATVDVFVKTKRPEIRKHDHHQDVCYAIGQKVLVEDLHTDTGGGGTNTAVAFSRLGFHTGWLGNVGTDIHCNPVLDQLRRERVKALCKPAEGKTGYSVVLTGLKENRTILAYKGVNDLLREEDIRWWKLRTRWFYFSAMLGESLETLKAVAAFARKKGIPYAFNASMYLAKQGTAKLAPIIDGCDLLVLNKEEAEAMTGEARTCPDQVKALHRFAKRVIVTDGPNTVHAYDGASCCEVTPPKVKVVEPTGAGDAFASGVLTGLLLKRGLCDAIKLGIVQSTSVIQRIGAKQGLLDRKEADARLQRLHLRVRREGI